MKHILRFICIISIILLVVSFLGVTAIPASARSDTRPALETVLLYDDFSTGSLDTSKWTAQTTTIAGKPVNAANIAFNTSYNDNGNIITVLDAKMYGTAHTPNTPTGGVITTNAKFAGGRYEVRMKNLPGANGCSCMWSYYDPIYDAPNTGTYTEIDIEMPAHLANPPAWSSWKYTLGLNTWNPTSSDADATYINYTSSINPFDGNFHIFRYDWYDGINGSKKIEWYLDGTLQASTTAHVGDMPAVLWVGNWPAPWPGMDYNFDTVHQYIDWVKITALGSGSNLISNPGWETGALSPWGSYNNSVVTGNAHSGTYSMKDTSDGSGEQTITGLTANTTYTITGWVKAGTGTMDIGAKNFGGSTTYATSASTAWTQLTVTFTTGASNTSATVYCYRSSGAAGGVGYCDDMSLTSGSTSTATPTPTNTPTTTPTNTPLPNLVSNPGWETGDISPWGSYNNSVVTGNAHTGTYSMKDTSDGSGEQTITGLTPNHLYTLKGWVKVGTGTMDIGAKNFGGTATYSTSSSTSWTQLTVTFTTGASNTSAVIYCYRSSGAAGGVGYCDDFTLN